MKHAIVIGGSMSGLLAARVLSERYQVTVLERDTLPTRAAPRKGVPQARHFHTLLAKGGELLEELFPGFDQELDMRGVPRLAFGRDVGYLAPAGWAPRFEPGVAMRSATRDLLEALVRRRVRAIPNVAIRDGVDVVDLIGTKRITGVRTRTGELHADLVVDASGRGSRAPKWLAARGIAVREEVVDANIGYATRLYESVTPPAPWRAVFLAWSPPQTRSGTVFPMEDGRWMISLAGAAGDIPPADEAGFAAFARSLRAPHVAHALEHARPLGPIHASRATANRWRHFDVPPGFNVIGDAVCAFDPIYAQGMTVAALQAIALREHVGRAFQRKVARIVAPCWQMATGSDKKFLSRDHATPLFDAVLRLAVSDAGVARQLTRVIHMVAPPRSLVWPSIKAVLGRNLFDRLDAHPQIAE